MSEGEQEGPRSSEDEDALMKEWEAMADDGQADGEGGGGDDSA